MNHSEDESARNVSRHKEGCFDLLVLEVSNLPPRDPAVGY